MSNPLLHPVWLLLLSASADALPYPHLAVESQPLFKYFFILLLGPEKIFFLLQFRLAISLLGLT